MTLNEYQKLAQRTSNTERKDKLLCGVMGLNGEAGEVIDIVKKHIFQLHGLDKQKIIEETGDVLWYLAEIAEGLEMTLEDIARANIEKLKERYPRGFDEQISIGRYELE